MNLYYTVEKKMNKRNKRVIYLNNNNSHLTWKKSEDTVFTAPDLKRQPTDTSSNLLREKQRMHDGVVLFKCPISCLDNYTLLQKIFSSIYHQS